MKKEKLIQITVTENQAQLINHALDLYSRLATGQFKAIRNHWGIDKMLWEKQKDDYYYDVGEEELKALRNKLFQFEDNQDLNYSYGIHNQEVDNSARVAFDILQVIRHELWKSNPNRSQITVDSSVHLTSDNANERVPEAKIIMHPIVNSDELLKDNSDKNEK